MNKFIRWLLETLILDPLVFLFIWNVIVATMFSVNKITFTGALITSIIVNILWSGIKESMKN